MPEQTLPDSMAPNLVLLSIGINPSNYSVEKGFNFARPGNRFWPGLNASGLLIEPVEPGPAAVRLLLERDRIGFTDIVKRATPSAKDLHDDDYRLGANVLMSKIRVNKPRIAWFQGTSAYAKFLLHAMSVRRKVSSGLQEERIGTTRIFVTPNPSGANPAAAPKALLAHFRSLAEFRRTLTDE